MARHQPSATSFMDCLACGLGGIAMMSFILMVFPNRGQTVFEETVAIADSVFAKPAPIGQNLEARPNFFLVEHPCLKLRVGDEADQRDGGGDTGMLGFSTDTANKNEQRASILRVPASIQKEDVFLHECPDTGVVSVRRLRPTGPPDAEFILSGEEQYMLVLLQARWEWEVPQ